MGIRRNTYPRTHGGASQRTTRLFILPIPLHSVADTLKFLRHLKDPSRGLPYRLSQDLRTGHSNPVWESYRKLRRSESGRLFKNRMVRPQIFITRHRSPPFSTPCPQGRITISTTTTTTTTTVRLRCFFFPRSRKPMDIKRSLGYERCCKGGDMILAGVW